MGDYELDDFDEADGYGESEYADLAERLEHLEAASQQLAGVVGLLVGLAVAGDRKRPTPYPFGQAGAGLYRGFEGHKDSPKAPI